MDPPLETGDSYTVTTSVAQPTAEELRNVASSRPRSRAVGTCSSPTTCREEIGDLALRVDGATPTTSSTRRSRSRSASRTPAEFRYDGRHARSGRGPRSILEFLTESKAGFCQQFATLDGGDAPLDRHPVSGGRRLRDRAARARPGSTRSRRTCPRVGGGLLPGLGMDAVRADPEAGEPAVELRPPRRRLVPGDADGETGGETARRPAGPGGSQRRAHRERPEARERPAAADHRSRGRSTIAERPADQREDGAPARRDRAGLAPPPRPSGPCPPARGCACAGPRPSPGG